MPAASLQLDQREIVASLICSRLYFDLSLGERLALLKRLLSGQPAFAFGPRGSVTSTN